MIRIALLFSLLASAANANTFTTAVRLTKQTSSATAACGSPNAACLRLHTDNTLHFSSSSVADFQVGAGGGGGGLPSQTGNANKLLTTDGSNPSWTASLSGVTLGGTYSVSGTPTLATSLSVDADLARSIGNSTHRLAAISVQRLIGGSSNTSGHLVPNAADDTVALLAASQTFTNSTSARTYTSSAAIPQYGLVKFDTTSNHVVCVGTNDTAMSVAGVALDAAGGAGVAIRVAGPGSTTILLNDGNATINPGDPLVRSPSVSCRVRTGSDVNYFVAGAATGCTGSDCQVTAQ